MMNGPLLTLEPHAKADDFLTVWFAAKGDVPRERSLVFRKAGLYRYRITFILSGTLRAEQQLFSTEGTVKVSEQKKGFTTFVKGLSGVIFDKEHVRFRDRAKLEALLNDEELRNSPYADYAKWLRIRSYLRDGVVDGNDILESGGDAAQREVLLLSELADDLLKGDGHKNQPPIRRDAMLTNGFVQLFAGDKAAAAETLKKTDAEFPLSKGSHGSRRLRSWTK